MPDDIRIPLEPIVALGTPRGKGSYVPIKRKDGGVFMKSAAAVVSWQGVVRDAALQQLPKAEGFQFPWPNPVELSLDFLFTRPGNHYRSGKMRDLLKDSAPRVMSKTPDIDKLIRAILDALTGVLFLDDAQVCAVRAWKRWVMAESPSRVIITPYLYTKGEPE